MKYFIFLFFTAMSLLSTNDLLAKPKQSKAAGGDPYSRLGLQNNTSNPEYTLCFTSYENTPPPSNNNAWCESSCYGSLPYGAQQWVDIWDKGSYITLNYNVCSGMSGGSCSGYVGNVSITFTATNTSVVGQGGTASLSTNNGSLFLLTFNASTPPTPVFPTPSSYQGVMYRGVNLSGGEFTSGVQFPYPSDAVYFVNQGMNTIRIPFTWESLQAGTPLGVGIDFSKGNAKTLLDLTNTLTDAGIYVILDMHNYMRYKGNVIGVSPGPTPEQYAIAWASIALPFKHNSLVFFDLMNEPNSMSTEQILINYNAAIKSIRDEGANNLVLLEGNQWACLAAWGGNNYSRNNPYGTSPCYYGTPNSDVFVPATGKNTDGTYNGIYDPANNYAINVHEYFSDPNGCGSECSSSDTVCCVNPNDVLTDEMFQPFVDWLQSTKQRAFLTELNGNPTTNCDQCIYNFLVAVQNAPNQVNNSQNTGGFIGWTGWAGGHAWPVDYVFNLDPYSDGTQRTQMINGFNPQLTPPQ